ncbi:MAG: transglutaminase family protein [Anaerolineaceae bacterium]
MGKYAWLSIILIGGTFLCNACGSSTPTQPLETIPTETISVPTSAPTLAPTPTNAAPPLAYNNPVKYKATYSFAIYNSAYSPSDIRVYMPVPTVYDSQPDLVMESISPQPTSQTLDPASGNTMAFWKFSGTPKKGESIQLKEVFTFTAYEINTNIDPASIQAYNTGSDLYLRNTQAEQYIESTDTQIIDLANQIAAEETNPYLVAQKIYNYIIANEKFKMMDKGLYGAKLMLANGGGEAADFAALFVALARAKDIPARPVVGLTTTSGSDQTDVWSEFYLEGIGWIPVDAAAGVNYPYKSDYYFGNLDSGHVVMSKGFNIPSLPTAPEEDVFAFLQVPYYWYYGQGKDGQISFTFNWLIFETH